LYKGGPLLAQDHARHSLLNLDSAADSVAAVGLFWGITFFHARKLGNQKLIEKMYRLETEYSYPISIKSSRASSGKYVDGEE